MRGHCRFATWEDFSVRVEGQGVVSDLVASLGVHAKLSPQLSRRARHGRMAGPRHGRNSASHIEFVTNRPTVSATVPIVHTLMMLCMLSIADGTVDRSPVAYDARPYLHSTNSFPRGRQAKSAHSDPFSYSEFPAWSSPKQALTTT